MRRIDELHLDIRSRAAACCGTCCNGEGFVVGRHHVATLMKRMGIVAIYRRPNTRNRRRATKFTRICCAR